LSFLTIADFLLYLKKQGSLINSFYDLRFIIVRIMHARTGWALLHDSAYKTVGPRIPRPHMLNLKNALNVYENLSAGGAPGSGVDAFTGSGS
jgi:hypothetical protein